MHAKDKIGILVALCSSAAYFTPAAVADQVTAAYGSSTPIGSWYYAEDMNVGEAGNTSYFPTKAFDPNAVAQGDVALPSDGTWGGANFFGTDETFIFSTDITAQQDMTIPLVIDGDDGHSLFVNGNLVGGGGLAAVFPYSLTLTAGVPVNIEAADHNAIGTWDLNVLTASGPALSQLPGISFDAAPPSAAPAVPESSSLLLLGLGMGGLLLTAHKRRRA